MISEEELRELERFLELEIKARDAYEDIIKKIKDNETRERLLRIRDEEVKHINLLKKAIEDARV
jgi:rubrerythrin